MKGFKKETMSVAEAARRLGVGINRAYESARRGEIPAIRLGSRILIPVKAFEAWLSGESNDSSNQ